MSGKRPGCRIVAVETAQQRIGPGCRNTVLFPAQATGVVIGMAVGGIQQVTVVTVLVGGVDTEADFFADPGTQAGTGLGARTLDLGCPGNNAAQSQCRGRAEHRVQFQRSGLIVVIGQHGTG